MLLATKSRQRSLALFVLVNCFISEQSANKNKIICALCKSADRITTEESETLCQETKNCRIHMCGAFRAATLYRCENADCSRWMGEFRYKGKCRYERDDHTGHKGYTCRSCYQSRNR
ncbi:hypothetical protein H4Q26_016927 [Puccinia striiformis f. sp. tritici PST-130]|nr:hypothetical protein H4Q26_016927 [Puccinia striiformis f. sp. tritici PST-130]